MSRIERRRRLSAVQPEEGGPTLMMMRPRATYSLGDWPKHLEECFTGVSRPVLAAIQSRPVR